MGGHFHCGCVTVWSLMVREEGLVSGLFSFDVRRGSVVSVFCASNVVGRGHSRLSSQHHIIIQEAYIGTVDSCTFCVYF